MSSTPIDLVICDMAGTTIDDRDEVYRVLREAAEREGARFSAEVFQEHMGMEKHHALGELLRIGTDLDAEAREAAWARAWDWFREELRRTYTAEPPTPLPGVPELIEELRARGIPLGLTTGFSREIADIILDALGWTADASRCGDEVPEGRPAPDLIRAVMADLGVTDARRVLSVGDTAADVASARAAGVRSVGVLTGHLSCEDFERLGAEHVLPGAGEIPSLIDSL
ncbi:HAD-IA family hydrolase [Corynebacterium uropygiale]|uniref:HAD-IA family hydrolase n=1 Tax=Corynebacterium uropygiale TaxID=1775911 RepID=A0A9X1QTU6_9CORY|nr:HAD-IA family hydrolase [Corynebacterium uropygiale]MCF4007718.1 HAD-IA family hydrolase [Corynebacterium uropygiale]